MRNRTANYGPNQNGAQTEHRTAEHTTEEKTSKNKIDIVHAHCVAGIVFVAHSPECNFLFYIERLQMWTTINVKCCTKQSVDQKEIGDITFWNQSVEKQMTK